MKQLLVILLFPLISYSQVDTCFTEEEIHSISETLDSLYYQDSLNLSIIEQQKSIITDLEYIIHLDSLQAEYREQQIVLLKDNINLYVEREKYLKPKWYKHPAVWFFSGIGTAVLTSKLIIEVVK